MLNPLRTLVATAFGFAIALAGCDDRDWVPRLAHAVGSDPAVVATTARAGDADGSVTTGAPAEPIEIYYDLTVFEWYGKGEPLLFDGRGYQPGDRPLAIAADELVRAGNFRGVDFYVRRADPPPYGVVYVPVFPGYWEPFVTEAREPLPAE